jgi:hypothetical protein
MRILTNSSRLSWDRSASCSALLCALCVALLNSGCATQALLRKSNPRESTTVGGIPRAFITPENKLVLNVRNLEYRGWNRNEAALIVPIDDVRSDHDTHSRESSSPHVDIMLPPHVIRRGWIKGNPSAREIPVISVRHTQSRSEHEDILRRLSGGNAPEVAVFSRSGPFVSHVAYHDSTEPLSQQPYVRFVLPETQLYHRRALLVLLPLTLAADVVTLPFQLFYISALDGMF